jgi:Xaa-Pro aminopeptidase
VLPFDDAEYARRNKALLEAMRADDVDVLIITAPDTRCWLTGYTSRWYRAGASSAMPPTQCLVVPADGGNPYMIETGFHEQLVRLTSNIEDFRAVPGTDLNHEPGLEEFVQFLIKNLAGEVTRADASVSNSIAGLEGFVESPLGGDSAFPGQSFVARRTGSWVHVGPARRFLSTVSRTPPRVPKPPPLSRGACRPGS